MLQPLQYIIWFDSENFGENKGKRTPDLEEHSLAVESQINEKYATEASNHGFYVGDIEESNLPEKKNKINK